jgi:hypothetical protein
VQKIFKRCLQAQEYPAEEEKATMDYHHCWRSGTAELNQHIFLIKCAWYSIRFIASYSIG